MAQDALIMAATSDEEQLFNCEYRQIGLWVAMEQKLTLSILVKLASSSGGRRQLENLLRRIVGIA